MLSRDNMPQKYIDEVKRHLRVTWNDADTDDTIIDMMLDAEAELNHMLGSEVDYFSPGIPHKLYLNYVLYAFNDCSEQFEDAYRKDIIRVRHNIAVKRVKDEAEV